MMHQRIRAAVAAGLLLLGLTGADVRAGIWTHVDGYIGARAKDPAVPEVYITKAMTLATSDEAYAEAVSRGNAFALTGYALTPSAITISADVYSNGDVQVIDGVQRRSYAAAHGLLSFTLAETTDYTFTLDTSDVEGAAATSARLTLGKDDVFFFDADATHSGTLTAGTYVLNIALSANHLFSTPQPPMFGTLSATLAVPEPMSLTPLLLGLISLSRRRRHPR